MKRVRRPVSVAGALAIAGAGLLVAGRADAVAGAAPATTRVPHAVRSVLSDPAGSEGAGYAIAADSDTVAVGADGTVSLYPLTAGTPTTISPEVTITSPDGPDDEDFRDALAIDGNLLVVADRFAAPGGDPSDSGVVYVYQRPASGWKAMSTTPVATIPSPAPIADGFFGCSVAVQGRTVVVGAPQEAGGDGQVYVFTEPATGWEGSGPTWVTLSSPVSNSDVGQSVAIEGDVIVAGAPYVNSVESGSGAVAVYVKSGSQWQNAGPTRLLVADPVAQADIGSSVAIDSQYVVAGGFSNDDDPPVDVFKRPAGGWAGSTDLTPSATLTDPSLKYSSTRFGSSVAISPARIFVGAPLADNGGDVDEFAMPSAGWADSSKPAFRLTYDPARTDSSLGAQVKVSGQHLVVGDSDYIRSSSDVGHPEGAAYVYTTLPVPVLSSVHQSRSTWQPGSKLPSVNPKQPFVQGTAFLFRSNQTATVTFSFAKKSASGHYGRPHRLTVTVAKGSNAVFFDGRISTSKKLAAGFYRVVLRAKNAAADTSTSHSLSFTIR